MIFGWLEYGRTDRWIMVDAVFPWPALHNGREAIRRWADLQQVLRVRAQSPGPRRCPWPCKTAVKETGDAELRIWPCGVFGKPRRWTARDRVWRPEVAELSACVATDIGCPVTVLWMGSDGEPVRAVSPPGLRGRGFVCWGKGERQPKDETGRLTPDVIAGMNMRIGDVRTLRQGERAWR